MSDFPLRDAEVVGDGQLRAECAICKRVHIFDTGGRQPMGGIIYVETVCDHRKAFDRYHVFRRRVPLRIISEEKE